LIDIMTGLSAISETLKISKKLRAVDKKIDEAEWKLRLADVIDGLLEAKEALQNAKERERELLHKIEEMGDKLNKKGKFEDEDGLLYEVDKKGVRFGKPYCNLCFVRDDKLYRLRYTPAEAEYSANYRCENCNNWVNQQ